MSFFGNLLYKKVGGFNDAAKSLKTYTENLRYQRRFEAERRIVPRHDEAKVAKAVRDINTAGRAAGIYTASTNLVPGLPSGNRRRDFLLKSGSSAILRRELGRAGTESVAATQPKRQMPHYGSYGRRQRYQRKRPTYRRKPRRNTTRRRTVTTRLGTKGLSRPTITAIGRNPVLKGSVFPPQLSTKMLNGLTITHTDSGSTYPAILKTLEINLNSMIKPFQVPSNTQRSMFYDELNVLYRKTLVTAAMIEITPYDYGASENIENITKLTQGDELTAPGIPAAMTLPNMSYFTRSHVTPEIQTNRVTYKRYVNMARFFSQNVNAEDKFSEGTAIIADPASRCVLLWHHRHADGSNTVASQMRYKITLTQWVTWSERKNIGTS